MQDLWWKLIIEHASQSFTFSAPLSMHPQKHGIAVNSPINRTFTFSVPVGPHELHINHTLIITKQIKCFSTQHSVVTGLSLFSVYASLCQRRLTFFYYPRQQAPSRVRSTRPSAAKYGIALLQVRAPYIKLNSKP